MGAEFDRAYLDACVYLAVIKNEEGRAPVCKAVLDAASAGRITLVASPILRVETSRIRNVGQVTDEQQEVIDRFFDHPFIEWVDCDDFVSREARELGKGYSLKPMDAIHLASALVGRADVLLTYDGRLLKVKRDDLRVTKPLDPDGPNLFTQE